MADPRHAHPSPFQGVPSFFRACCLEAAADSSRGYERAGFHLAIHVFALRDGDYEHEDDFHARLEELRAALDARDVTQIWVWFRAEFPKCIALVPPRRKKSFVEGVLRAHTDGRVLPWRAPEQPRAFAGSDRTTAKSREARLRRRVAVLGYSIRKSRRRDPNALCFGTYQIIDPRSNGLVYADYMNGSAGFGLSLDDIEAWLAQDEAGASPVVVGR